MGERSGEKWWKSGSKWYKVDNVDNFVDNFPPDGFFKIIRKIEREDFIIKFWQKGESRVQG